MQRLGHLAFKFFSQYFFSPAAAYPFQEKA